MTHKPDNYVRCQIGGCRVEGCPEETIYGPRGEPASHCRLHKLPNHVNQYKDRTCQALGCSGVRIHAFGAKFCHAHSNPRDLQRIIPADQPLRCVKRPIASAERKENRRRKLIEKRSPANPAGKDSSSIRPRPGRESPDLLSDDDTDDELLDLIANRVRTNPDFLEKVRARLSRV